MRRPSNTSASRNLNASANHSSRGSNPGNSNSPGRPVSSASEDDGETMGALAQALSAHLLAGETEEEETLAPAKAPTPVAPAMQEASAEPAAETDTAEAAPEAETVAETRR